MFVFLKKKTFHDVGTPKMSPLHTPMATINNSQVQAATGEIERVSIGYMW